MPAAQFWHAGGEVFAAGAVPVSDTDAAILVEIFADHIAAAAAAGALETALAWTRATETLALALAERARWRAAVRCSLAA